MRNLLILIAFISLSASAQKYQDALLYGKKENRIMALANLGIPNDTIHPPSVDSANYKPHVASKGGVLYLWNIALQRWISIGTGAINTAPPIYNFGDTIQLSVVPPSLGGTGQSNVGTPYQLLRTNAGATATEWWTANYLTRDSLNYFTFHYPLYKTTGTGDVYIDMQADGYNSNAIHGITIATTSPHNGDVQTYNASTNQYEPKPTNGGIVVGFTPLTSTDNQYPVGTPALDDSYFWYRTSGGTWKKIALTAF